MCGNGVLEAGEQCDDGNLFDLDGCDSHCKYEMVTRMTSVVIQSTAAPSFCVPTTNALGTKVIANATALNQLNTPLTTDVGNGSLDVLTQFLSLTDLTGTNASGFSIGVINGSLDPAKGTWPGNNPIDWWFLADHTTVSMGLPTGLLTNGSIVNHALKAGPNNVFMTLNFAGTPAVLQMLHATLAGTIGTPVDTPAPPPSKLEAGLQVLETITANATGQGLCGNITVASLAQIPIPQTLATGGGTACVACKNSHTYTYCGAGLPVTASCNSMLDVIVGGCGLINLGGNCLVAAVNPTQPDVPVGAKVAPLSVGGTLNKVTQNVTNDDDAYSSYLQFTANRAHITGETCTVTSDCQAGKTCPAGGGTCK